MIEMKTFSESGIYVLMIMWLFDVCRFCRKARGDREPSDRSNCRGLYIFICVFLYFDIMDVSEKGN